MAVQPPAVKTYKQEVFLGSSREAMWLARAIEGVLSTFEEIEVNAWYHFGSWELGTSTLESLEARLSECDLAVLVLSDDDWTQSRDNEPRPAPRDNLLFELGLFMGRLGRDRAFFFFPQNRDFKLPSDLFGITALPYPHIEDRGRAARVVSPLCTLVANHIAEVVKRQPEVRPRLEPTVNFPKDNNVVDRTLPSLPSSNVSILKLRIAIKDEDISDVRVYFDPRLNLHRAAWTYRHDDRGKFFWASNPQRDAMKQRGADLSFEIEYPRRGTHEIEVVAFSGAEPKYVKTFAITIS
jgi:CAP12/Pycsar effector protein, TIR domain